MIQINGAIGSGGGQIIRTACALSTITQKPCRIFNIRRERPKPGLMPQHLSGIQVLARLFNGRLEKDFLGSKEIKFFPDKPNINQPDRDPFSINIKIETAGSITLILQALIPAALFFPTPVKIIIDGGASDTFFSPTVDYFQFVFLKVLKKILDPLNCKEDSPKSGRVEIKILKRGYYPKGGAKTEIMVYPIERKKINSVPLFEKNKYKINLLERGNLQKIIVISGASDCLKEKKVAERQIMGTKEVLGKLNLPIEEKIDYHQTQCPGSQICLVAEFENTIIGTDNLGKINKRAEDVGKEAALELLKEQKSEACLDKYLADQILIFLALSKEKSRITVSEITEHCQTNIQIIEKFIEGKFEIKNNLITWLPA